MPPYLETVSLVAIETDWCFQRQSDSDATRDIVSIQSWFTRSDRMATGSSHQISETGRDLDAYNFYPNPNIQSIQYLASQLRLEAFIQIDVIASDKQMISRRKITREFPILIKWQWYVEYQAQFIYIYIYIYIYIENIFSFPLLYQFDSS